MTKTTDTNPKSRAWGLFLLAHTVLLEKIEAQLSAAELPPLAWYDVLWELEKAPDGKLRMHELADRIVLSRYNLTRLADRIEQAQLIRREDCAEDRRGYDLVITPAGIAVRKSMWRVYAPLIDAFFSEHLSDATASSMVQSFTHMIRTARAWPGTKAVAAPAKPKLRR